MTKHTPGPWEAMWTNDVGPDDEYYVEFYEILDAQGNQVGTAEKKHDAVLMAVAPKLLEALKEYENAEKMPTYGDASDFVWPKLNMRKPGETAWGWICEKHGLGYQSGCICCQNEFDSYRERKNSDARHARDDALYIARKKARAAIAKATGEQA